MKFFQPIRECFGDLGFYSSRPNTLKSSVLIVNAAVYFLLSAAFFFEAQTLREYAESFYGSATPLFILSILVIYAWKKENIFALMNSCEILIEKRKIQLDKRQQLLQ